MAGAESGPFLNSWRRLLAWNIHEVCREASETEVRLGFAQVRPTQTYVQAVEDTEREKPRRVRGLDDEAGIHE